MSVGIVGSGIAGLVSAWRLSKAGMKVTLFESSDRLGMAAHEVDIKFGATSLTGDVPSRMFNRELWPHLFSIYKQIGVRFEPVHPGQSLNNERGKTYLRFPVGFRPTIAPHWLAGNRNRRITMDLFRFRRQGLRDLESGIGNEVSLQEYLDNGGLTREFQDYFLFPTLATTVCTCSYQALRRYPASIILAGLKRIASKEPLLRVVAGSSDVVARLSAPVADIRLNSEVRQVCTQGDRVTVESVSGQTQSRQEEFDFVILATQANHAAHLVSDSDDRVHEILSSFVYENVPVVVHQDESFMPNRPRDWTTFNMFADDSSAGMCTVWMNQFHRQWETDEQVFQTIQTLRTVPAEKVVKRVNLQRPVVDATSFSKWRHLELMNRQSRRRVFFAGSYAMPGIPLLETGAESASQVASIILGRCGHAVATH